MTRIVSIGVALGSRELTDAELARENPDWDIDLIAELSGVRSRRLAAPGETAFDLSVRACQQLSDDGTDLGATDAILYCTQTPDHRMPGNAHLLHRALDLPDRVLAVDVSLACSGFVYGLGLADSLVRSGTASNVLLVTAETVSAMVDRRDRSVAPLFGDGAAATYLAAGKGLGGRVAATRLCTHGAALDRILIPVGAEHIQMDGPAVWGFVNSTIPNHVAGFLADQGLTIDDVDLCVFHQASRVVLGSLAKALAIDEDRMFVHMEDLGNLSSASIPVALQAALRQGAVAGGGRILMTAYGAGMSYGSALVEYPAQDPGGAGG